MKKSLVAVILCICFSYPILPAGLDLQMNALRFGEGRTVKVNMVPTSRASESQMKVQVKYEEGQQRIELEYKDLKPAVLFGGDITCYVLWAINRDGAAQNLGELWVRPDSDKEKVLFSTGLRNFALLVTAESYYQISEPSELVVFQNSAEADPPVGSDPLVFSSFGPAASYGVEDLSSVRYDGKKPLDLLQAETVLRIARGMKAEEYAPQLFDQASISLEQATHMFERSVKKGTQRYARSSVAASNEAISLTQRKVMLEELENRIAARQSQMESLEARASQAEQSLQAAQQKNQELAAKASESEARLAEAASSLERVRTERTAAESAIAELLSRQKTLQASMKDLEVEKTDLQSKLQSALSMVADTRESARGLIVSLPDILFDVGEATLRPEASMALAKMAGILLIMSDLNVRVEGHTDSTGSPSFNLRLSERRAESVFDLLASQGIASSRIKTVGYGIERPVADNSTAEGRRKNRRVELIVAEGVIAEG